MKTKRLKKKRLDKMEYREGSGNVFADIGIPNPEEALAKAKIAMKIHEGIKKKKLNQAKAAKILGLAQPKLSELLRGHFRGYSIERLIHFLNELGKDVDAVVKAKPAS
jgi:predicted XRE-type DNA-binding protein